MLNNRYDETNCSIHWDQHNQVSSTNGCNNEKEDNLCQGLPFSPISMQ